MGTRKRAASSDAELDSLLVETSRGCRRSFGDFHDRTRPLSFTIVLRINGDRHEAEELCQDLYLKVWLSAENFRPDKGTALAWLTTMARNTARSSLRARVSRPQTIARLPDSEHDLHDDIPSGEPGPLDIVAAREASRLAQAALDGLPRPQRQCLHLAMDDGLTHQEVAARLRRPLGTVKAWIKRSHDALRVPLRACAP